MTHPTIREGCFALVGAGNVTTAWIEDGPDVQARADAARDSYWSDGKPAPVYQRNVPGHAVMLEGRVLDLFTTRAAAESYLARIGDA